MKINNQTRDVLSKKMTPFKKSKKSNSIEDNLTDYYFENLYLKPDGGYYLVAQKLHGNKLLHGS